MASKHTKQIKKHVFLAITVILILLFSGCTTQKNNEIENPQAKIEDTYPVPVIKTASEGYFGEPITFDASDSYDDGEIVSYKWFFYGDKKTVQGEKVTHTFNFSKEFNVEYPLFIPFQLQVIDDGNNLAVTEQKIKLYPKNYNFYLKPGEITINKPELNQEKLKLSLGTIKPVVNLIYELDETIEIFPSTWSVNLTINKAFLANIKEISVSLLNNQDETISQSTTSNRENKRFWREKTIQISGENRADQFKKIEIEITGFSLLESVSIIYGGDNPSSLCFNFWER